jgi:hypothetical protein
MQRSSPTVPSCQTIWDWTGGDASPTAASSDGIAAGPSLS